MTAPATDTGVRPIRVAERVAQAGRNAATNVSVDEISALAICLLHFTGIVEDTAQLILDIETFRDLEADSPNTIDRDELLERLVSIRERIDATGILAAVAEVRRPSDG